MLKNKTIIVMFVLIVIVGTGCTKQEEEPSSDNTEPTTENSTDETKQDESQTEADNHPSSEEMNVENISLPSTFEALEALPAGEDAGPVYDYESEKSTSEQDKEIAEHFSDLPFPEDKENPTDQELDYLYREILKRVQLDFQGPEKLMKDLKFQSLGNPDIEDSRYQFKEQLNVVILLDASGSMAQVINGKTKMKAAKDAISNFLNELPEETKVALRVYGHKGTGSDEDKKMSCRSTDRIYGFDSYDADSFMKSLNQIEPAGWTPTGLALKEAQKDLSAFDGSKNTNIVYLVSDGIETCDTNPVQTAKKLYDSKITPIINVLGFDVDGEGQNQLQEIADSVDGIYQTVSDENELMNELEKVNEIADAWQDWKEQGMQSIDLQHVSNELDIFVYTTDEESKVVDERTRINFIVNALNDYGHISNESRKYLEEKNSDYHDWILSEIDTFEKELEAMNDKGYKEAVKALEEKYELNVDE
ncbi:Ca-activated chloride channel family protein [Salinibacillus kushneri]|uniref:Ca-activated chloride channel family protein n=1 Tax=Salinibacillus kushneri TaxID=237682 RepID=A0A1I0J5W2_9BACI|nr:Ca-activated chloride channel family protein [Salinibacillus kushneri]